MVLDYSHHLRLHKSAREEELEKRAAKLSAAVSAISAINQELSSLLNKWSELRPQITDHVASGIQGKER